ARSVVVLRDEAVVQWTHQTDCVWSMVAAEAEGIAEVQFQAVTLGAATSLLVQVTALHPVSPRDEALDGRRDVPRRSRRIAVPQLFPRFAGRPEPPCLEPLELLGHGLLDDRGEISVGDLRPHEGPKSFQLVVKTGTGGKLDLVSGGREGLDD